MNTKTTGTLHAKLMVVLCGLIGLAACSAKASEPFVWADAVGARYGGANHAMHIAYGGVEYFDNETCGAGTHFTRKSHLCFWHIHLSPNYNITTVPCVDEYNNPHALLLSEINGYWTNLYYPPPYYTALGGETLWYNCWGYAMGYSTWIQDASILDDDYQYAYGWSDATLFANSTHSVKVYGTAEDQYYITREKFRESGIYERIWLPWEGWPIDLPYKPQ